MQLTLLVGKLDRLTQKPLAITLNDQQRAKVREALKGLEIPDDLKEEEAKTRLNSLLEVLEKDKEILVASGFFWPGEGRGFKPPQTPPNPFKEKDNEQRLKSLQGYVGK
jgi:hypothetical protein